MRSEVFKLICRFLVAALMLMSFTTARAALIGADQVASSSSAQLDRAAVMSILQRSEVASQLQAQGLDPAVATERVNSMTDQEVHMLRGQVEALPAGATSNWGWAAAVIIIALIIWYMWK